MKDISVEFTALSSSLVRWRAELGREQREWQGEVFFDAASISKALVIEK